MGNLLKETPFSEIMATLEVLDKFGWGRQHLYLLRTEPELAESITKHIKNYLGPIYRVTVDYSRSLQQMIEAGHYDRIDDDINANNFHNKSEGKVETEIILRNYYEAMENNEFIAKMNEENLRPATLEELLALGSQHPGLLRRFTVVALGSQWHGNGGRQIPFLNGYNSWRVLDLHWINDRWDAHCRFAAVKK